LSGIWILPGRGMISRTMIEIGAFLAQARVRRGLSLANAAKETRLRELYLQALEQEEFDQLPPGSYRIAFLRTYAVFLDLDADLLVDEYVARYEQPSPSPRAVPPPFTVGRPRRRRRHSS
jgi:cytoskeleton protein RodZ